MVAVRLFRHQNPDGTAKDWAVPVAPDPEGLDVYFGRAGKPLRLARTPRGKCTGGDPALERDARVHEKLAKGYRDLGQHALADDRRTLVPATGPDAPPATAGPPCLYWRWKPAGGAADLAAAIGAAAAEAAAKVAAAGWRLDLPPGADGPATWAALAGGLSGGTVPIRPGAEPPIAFWLALARACPEVSVYGEDGRPAGWPEALAAPPGALEGLGLKARDLNALLAAGDGGDGDGWYFS